MHVPAKDNSYFDPWSMENTPQHSVMQLVNPVVVPFGTEGTSNDRFSCLDESISLIC